MSGAHLPRRVALRGGGEAVLRRFRAADAPALAAMLQRVARAGEGVVSDEDEVQSDEAALTRSMVRLVRGAGPGVRGLALVAEADGALIGEVSVRRHRPRRLHHIGHFGLSVDPAWQGRGVGRALMESALAWARRRGSGLLRLDLAVLADNARAVALYESLGFRREGVRERFVREGDGRLRDDLLMALWIGEAEGVRGDRRAG